MESVSKEVEVQTIIPNEPPVEDAKTKLHKELDNWIENGRGLGEERERVVTWLKDAIEKERVSLEDINIENVTGISELNEIVQRYYPGLAILKPSSSIPHSNPLPQAGEGVNSGLIEQKDEIIDITSGKHPELQSVSATPQQTIAETDEEDIDNPDDVIIPLDEALTEVVEAPQTVPASFRSILEAFRDDPLLSNNREILLWNASCLVSPACIQASIYLAGYAVGATPATVSQSFVAGLSGAIASGAVGAGFSYLSTKNDPKLTFRARVLESLRWGAVNFSSGVVLQPANRVLVNHVPAGVIPPLVGTLTTTGFVTTLSISEGILYARDRCGNDDKPRRELGLQNVFGYILLSTLSGASDVALALIGLETPLNRIKNTTNFTDPEVYEEIGIATWLGWSFPTIVLLGAIGGRVLLNRCYFSDKAKEADEADPQPKLRVDTPLLVDKKTDYMVDIESNGKYLSDDVEEDSRCGSCTLF